MAESDLNYKERRRMYRRVWHQKQLAKNKPDYNEMYWEQQLEKYRAPVGKKFVVHKSKTTAYRNDKSRERYKSDPEYVHAKTYRSGFRWTLKDDSPVPKKDIEIMC